MLYTLITGASTGLGEEFARQYAAKGHALILVARSGHLLEELAQELSEKHSVPIWIIQQDLAKTDAAEELFAKCKSKKLEVNLLINNAGIGLVEKFEKHEFPRIEEMLILNNITLTKLTYLFLGDLKKHQGGIINVSSQAAFESIPNMGAYAATKAYVQSFTEALREELKDSHVQVMALCPGPTHTKFFEKADTTSSNIRFKFRTPKEVVKAAIYGMEHHKAIVIPGWENRMMTFVTQTSPRSFSTKMSQFMVKHP